MARLPPEILDHVVDTFVWSNPGRNAHLPTLASLALTSSLTRMRAQYHTFSLLKLRINSEIQTTARNLLDLLDSNPSLTGYIRDVELTFCTLNWLYVSKRHSSTILSRQPLTRILQEWRRLGRDFHWPNMSWLWFGDSLIELLYVLIRTSRVEKVSVVGNPIFLAWDEVVARNERLSDAIKQLLTLETVKTLRIVKVSVFPPEFILHPAGDLSPRRSLKNLVFQGVTFHRSAASYSSSKQPALLQLVALQDVERLELNNTGAYPLEFIQACVGTEAISGYLMPQATLGSDAANKIIFSAFRNVRHLTLRIPSDVAGVEQCSTLLSQLSPRLESLSIHPVDEHAILEFLIQVLDPSLNILSLAKLHSFKLEVWCSPSLLSGSDVSLLRMINLLLPALGENLRNMPRETSAVGLKSLELVMKTSFPAEERAQKRDLNKEQGMIREPDYMADGWRTLEERLKGPGPSMRDFEKEKGPCVHALIYEAKSTPNLMAASLGFASLPLTSYPRAAECIACNTISQPAFAFLERFRVKFLFGKSDLSLASEQEILDCGWERVRKVQRLMPRLCGVYAMGVGVEVEFRVDIS